MKTSMVDKFEASRTKDVETKLKKVDEYMNLITELVKSKVCLILSHTEHNSAMMPVN